MPEQEVTVTHQRAVRFFYSNHRLEKRWRMVVPQGIYHGSTKFHKEPQWILRAFDLDKGDFRDFAIKDILSVWWQVELDEDGWRFV